VHKLSVGLQDFFFEAALATYAGNASKRSIEGLPGSKVYRYEKGNYLYIDTYFTNGDQSGGQTIIYIKSFTNPVEVYGVSVQDPCWVPAWIMQYHGWCKNDDKEVLDFLKEVLAKTYQTKSFCGGRGYPSFESIDDMLNYRNDWYGTFNQFDGEETIDKQVEDPEAMGLERTDVFWHRFQGMTLLPSSKEE
jgi:hypothetical protein